MVSKTDNNTTFIKKVGLILFALLFSFVIVACGGSDDEFEIVLDQTEIEMFVGDTKTITATIEPADATDEAIDWFSYDVDVVTVQNGLLEAVAPGEAEVSVTVGKVKKTVNVTVKEKVEEVEYTVSFLLDEDEGEEVEPIADQVVKEGSKATKPATDPVRVAYDFAGWYADILGTIEFDFDAEITKDTTVYARWTIKNFDVDFELNLEEGEEVSAEVPVQTVDYGMLVTKPEAPVKKESIEIFAGWFVDAELTEEFDFDTEVKEGFTLYAKWVITPVKVNFVGATIDAQEVTPGEKAKAPATPTREGFVLDGWFTDLTFADDKKFSFNTPVTEDITLYAKWSYDKDVYSAPVLDAGEGKWLPNDLAEYKLAPYDFAKIDSVKLDSFNNDFGGKYSNIVLGNKILTWWHCIGLKQLDNDTFEVMELSPAGAKESFVNENDFTLVAHDGNAAAYAFLGSLEVGQILTITGVDLEDDSPRYLDNAKINVYPDAFNPPVEDGLYFKKDDVLPVPHHGVKVFIGWYKDAEFTEAVEKYNGEEQLFAKWMNAYNVEFLDDEVDEEGNPKVIEKSIVFEGGKVEEPEAPTKAGFKFRGWFVDVECTEEFDFENTEITVNTLVYAKWVEVVTDDVIYEVEENADLGPVINVYPDLDVEAITAIRQIIAAGTILEEEVVVDLNNLTTDSLMFAVTDEEGKLNEEKGLYMYEVDTETGQFIFSFTYYPENVVGLDENVKRANVRYDAIWDQGLDAWTIVVEFADLDDSIVETVNIINQAGTKLELPISLRTDGSNLLYFDVAKEDGDLGFRDFGKYIFRVTTRDGGEFDYEFHYYPENVTNITYNVNIEVNGGRIEGPFSKTFLVDKGTVLPVIPEPTRSNYIFVDWFTDPEFDNKFDPKQPVNGDLNLYAKWEFVEFDITYHLDGGMSQTYGSFFTREELMTAFVTDFYKFVKPEEDLQTFMHGEGKTTGFAGTWAGKDEEENYLYLDKIYNGDRPEAQDEKSDLFIEAYYDKWISFFDTVEDYVVAVNAGQNFFGDKSVGLIRLPQYVNNMRPKHTMVPEELFMLDVYTYESLIKLPTLVKDGYTFEGWFTDAEFTNPISTIVVSYGDLNLYAKFEVIEAE